MFADTIPHQKIFSISVDKELNALEQILLKEIKSDIRHLFLPTNIKPIFTFKKEDTNIVYVDGKEDSKEMKVMDLFNENIFKLIKDNWFKISSEKGDLLVNDTRLLSFKPYRPHHSTILLERIIQNLIFKLSGPAILETKNKVNVGREIVDEISFFIHGKDFDEKNLNEATITKVYEIEGLISEIVYGVVKNIRTHKWSELYTTCDGFTLNLISLGDFRIIEWMKENKHKLKGIENG